MKKKVSDHDQVIVANVLTRLMFVKDMDEFIEEWKRIYDDYGLHDDPFTGTPCSSKEYVLSREEYQRQLEDRYWT